MNQAKYNPAFASYRWQMRDLLLIKYSLLKFDYDNKNQRDIPRLNLDIYNLDIY